MKKCPYCAEEIQEGAILCRYCKKDLREINHKVNINNRNNKIWVTILVPIGVLIGILILIGIFFFQSEGGATNSTKNPEGNDALCDWFIETQYLRSERISGISEFVNWYSSHDMETFTYSELEEMISLLVEYRTYLKNFVSDWKELGDYPDAHEFWQNELLSSEMKIEAIDLMEEGINTDNDDLIFEGMELFEQSKASGIKAEKSMLSIRNNCFEEFK